MHRCGNSAKKANALQPKPVTQMTMRYEKEGELIMIYGVKWNDSETKKIYKATTFSEQLMEYLERRLMEDELVKLSGEKPVPKRGYGMMIYYYSIDPKRQLLTAAPRRKQNYIHVVLTAKSIDNQTLNNNRITLGNYIDPLDVKLHTETEIDTLVALLKKHNSRLYNGK